MGKIIAEMKSSDEEESKVLKKFPPVLSEFIGLGEWGG